MSVRTLASVVILAALARASVAQDCPEAGFTLDEHEISDTAGGFISAGGEWSFIDAFGASIAHLGDLNDDGVDDLAIGAPRYQNVDTETFGGAVWICFMNADGTVNDVQLIADGAGGFAPDPFALERFGSSIAALGDLDGDGVTDLAVGDPFDNEIADGSGQLVGAVYILFMNADGTVAAHQRLGAETGGELTGEIETNERFGTSVAGLGDLDGDTVPDVAVGSPFRAGGGSARGSVMIIGLNPDGTVKGLQRIGDEGGATGGFGGSLIDLDLFGTSLARLDDLDDDGVPELAVGSVGFTSGGMGPAIPDRGAVWIVFLNFDGTVKDEYKIDFVDDALPGVEGSDAFGTSVAHLGDIDDDGSTDIAIGAPGDDDGGIGSEDRGAVWIVRLNPTGTAVFGGARKISDIESGFDGFLENGDRFGAALAGLGDRNGDGQFDLAATNLLDSSMIPLSGSAWLLDLDGCRVPPDSAEDIAGGSQGGDDVIDTFDLLLLLQNWNQNGPGADLAQPNDLVDTFDLLELIAAWGACE